MTLGMISTVDRAVKGDKEAQGELIGMATQAVAGGAFGRISGGKVRAPRVAEEPVVTRQAEANGGATVENQGAITESVRTATVNYEALYIKYKASRPGLSKTTLNEVWESAKQADGNVYDPNTGELLTWDKTKSRYDQWHMGHKPGHEYRVLLQRLRRGEITEAQFKEQYKNPNNYQPEAPAANMSHQYEQITPSQTQTSN